MLMKRLLVAVLVLGACTMTAHASLFLGGSVGDVNLKESDSSVDFKGSDTGYKFYGGFTFIKFFAVEASYVNFGSPKDDISAGTSAKIEPTAWDAYAVGKLPIGKHFEIFGKLGLVVWDASATYSGTVNGSSDESGTDSCYGAGIAFVFGKHFAVRAEYENFDLKDIDTLDMTSIGAEFRF